MGCAIEKTDSGQELQVHRFDDKAYAERYLAQGRGYVFDRHEPWAFTEGFDFYNFGGDGVDHTECNRAALRKRDGVWVVVFWKA